MSTRALLTLSALSLVACGESEPVNRFVGELSSDRIELSAEVAEPIVEILVDEGDPVTAGQILIRQRPERADAQVADAEAALERARARLSELVRGPRTEQIRAAQAAVEGAEREFDFRRSEYARAEEVHSRGLASPDSLDRAQAALDSSSASLEQLQAQLEELLAGTTLEELAQAEQSVRQAEARRDLAEIERDNVDIRAPADGVADSRLFEVGERPSPGMPVIVLLAGRQAHARVYIPETVRVHVSAGDSAQVFVDGIEEALNGRVRWVAAEPAFTPYFALTERDRGRLSYEAKIDLLNVDRRLPDGMPVEVEIAGIPE